jgi:MFS family permease
MAARAPYQASWGPLGVIIGSMVMMYVTSFGVNVLIAPIVSDFGSSVSHLQLVIVSASLIAGSLMVTAGRLGDKLGKTRVFRAGVAIYSAGMTIVVISPDITLFTIAWGVIWPSGMVLVIPTSIALILHFYEGQQRAIAFGIYGAVLSIISAFAPVLVGWLADVFGWRVALSISPLVGVLTWVGALRVPDTRRDASVTIDPLSVGLSVAGFGLFLVTTTQAGHFGWLWEKRPLILNGTQIGFGGFSFVVVLYALSAVLLLAFAVRGRSLKRAGGAPLLDLSLLRNIPFTAGSWIASLLYLVTAGTLFALSIYAQAGINMGSLDTALLLLPFSLAYAFTSFVTAPLGHRIAPKWIIIAASAATCGSLYWLSSSAHPDLTPSTLLLPMLGLGLVMGMIMAQVTSVTMSRISASQSGSASGLSETLKEIIGQGFAVALAGSVLFGAVYASMTHQYADIEEITLPASETTQIIIELEDIFQEITPEDELQWVAALPAKTRDAYPQIIDIAALNGLRAVLIAMMVAMAIALGLAFLLPNQRLPRD